MKKQIVLAVAAIAMVIAMVGGAYAGTVTPTVSATATVVGVCSAANDGVIDFGAALDAVANAGGVPFASVIVTPPTINCSAGTTYAVTSAGTWGGVNLGAGYRLKDPVSGAFIAYNFSYTTPITGKGFGAGTGIGGTGVGNLAMTPSISAGALDLAPAGTYGDTITLTITY